MQSLSRHRCQLPHSPPAIPPGASTSSAPPSAVEVLTVLIILQGNFTIAFNENYDSLKLALATDLKNAFHTTSITIVSVQLGSLRIEAAVGGREPQQLVSDLEALRAKPDEAFTQTISVAGDLSNQAVFSASGTGLLISTAEVLNAAPTVPVSPTGSSPGVAVGATMGILDLTGLVAAGFFLYTKRNKLGSERSTQEVDAHLINADRGALEEGMREAEESREVESGKEMTEVLPSGSSPET